MKATKVLTITCSLILSGGCASTISRRPLDERGYFIYSNISYGMEQCVVQGYLSIPEASETVYIFREFIESKFEIDGNKAQALEQDSRIRKTAIKRENCVEFAMLAQQRKQSITIERAQLAAQQSVLQQNIQNMNNSLPKYTYCNRIGTQTTCRTY